MDNPGETQPAVIKKDLAGFGERARGQEKADDILNTMKFFGEQIARDKGIPLEKVTMRDIIEFLKTKPELSQTTA